MRAFGWRLPAALASGLAASSLVAIAAAGATNVLGQAGYVLAPSGHVNAVHSLSAQWRVPVVERHSPLGVGLTYVGAINVNSGSELVVGTSETFALVAHRRTAIYQAYWGQTLHYPESPPAHDVHVVHGGDLVRATIGIVYAGWALHLQDISRGWEFSKTLPLVGYSFSEAAWLQEDPPTSAHAPPVEQAHDIAYPRLPTVTFTRVKLNGSLAPLSFGNGRALAVPNGPYLIPNKAHAGSFRVGPGTARQYLADVAPYDLGFSEFAYAIGSWKGSASAAAHDAAGVVPLIRGARSFAAAALAQRWPSSIAGQAHQLAAVCRRLAAVLSQVPALTTSTYGAWVKSLDAALVQTAPLFKSIRAAVGLPPPST